MIRKKIGNNIVTSYKATEIDLKKIKISVLTLYFKFSKKFNGALHMLKYQDATIEHFEFKKLDLHLQEYFIKITDLAIKKLNKLENK